MTCACGHGDAAPAPGTAGGACFANDTCMPGLACAQSKICVDPTTLAICDHPLLLWSTGFEPSDPVPPIITGDGSKKETPNAHGGAWVGTLFEGDALIESPFAVRVPGHNLMLTYWISNDDGSSGSEVTAEITTDSGGSWQLSSAAAVSLNHARPTWVQLAAPFELPAANEKVRVRLVLAIKNGTVDIDDMELTTTDPIDPCP